MTFSGTAKYTPRGSVGGEGHDAPAADLLHGKDHVRAVVVRLLGVEGQHPGTRFGPATPREPVG
jgi:hypothetical protein